MTDKEREALRLLQLSIDDGMIASLKHASKEIGVLLTDSPEPPRRWPPKGMIVEVWCPVSEIWALRYSGGDGYYSVDGYTLRQPYDKWRYPPVDWESAPKDAMQWTVWSDKTTDWQVARGCWRVGEELYDACVIHVENRPEVTHD